MGENKLPGDITGLGQPATKLIEAVSDAIGAIYEPTRIRRRAKAEADAALIVAEGQAQASQIAARAHERIRKRTLRRQENIEAITKQALDALPEQVAEQPVDQDWIHRFYGNCEDVGDEQMQILWGRILAGEMTQPGSFSMRTMRVVRDLSKDDATKFSSLCKFVWLVRDNFVPIIHDAQSDITKNENLNFLVLTHLASLDLIEFNNLSGFCFRKENRVIVSYFGAVVQLVSKTECDFPVGQVFLTTVGSELLKVANAEGDDMIKSAVIDGWEKQGWSIEGA